MDLSHAHFKTLAKPTIALCVNMLWRTEFMPLYLLFSKRLFPEDGNMLSDILIFVLCGTVVIISASNYC